MAEYIYAERVLSSKSYEDCLVESIVDPYGERLEEIVRCRDCKYAIEHRSKSILGTEIVTLTCSVPIQVAYSEGADVEPEDFCSYGAMRDGD